MANVNGTEINLMPTESMRSAARQYKKWKKEGRPGGTDDAARRANQILSGRELSPDVVITMNAWFARHESDKSGKGFNSGEEGYPSRGRVSWSAWGSDSGQTWARSKSNAIKKARERTMTEATSERAAPDALKTGDFVSWNASGGRARGKITRVVRDGKIDVPSSSFVINGTPEDPAALIQVYRNGESTDIFAGHRFSALSKIAPIRVIDETDKLERKEITNFNNTKGRTFEFPFSSEMPVTRFFGDEVLSHEEGSANLERLNDSAPFLFNHNPDKVLGVVESAYIKDRRGYAKIRFSRSKFATEVLEDVKDGILRGISFGYSLNEVEETENGLRAVSWTPHEVSLATIPADNSVGFGRSLVENISSENVTLEQEDIIINVKSSEKEIRQAVTTAQSNPSMEEPTNETAVEQKPTVETIDVQAEVQRALDENNARVAEITSTCREFREYGAEDLTETLIKSGKSATEARSAILDLVKNKKVTPIRSTDMEIEGKRSEEFLDKKEAQNFSFLRAINALANPADKAAQEAATYEREVSEEAAKRYGRPAKGILIPNEVLKRDLNVGTAADGGNLVSTELLSGSFIELLRNKMAIMEAGVTMLTGLEGNISIPKQDGSTSAYWVGENQSPTEGQQSFTQISMTPKTIGAFTDFTRRTLLQSSIDIEAFVRDDIAKKIALELDRTAIYGTGTSNQPLGIKDTSGIGSQSLTSFGTFAEYIGMETDVAVANAEGNAMKYIINASARGALKSTEKTSTSTANFVFENNQINGYQAIVTNQLLNNDAIFGDFSQFIVGMWSGLDLTVDPFAGATAGTVRIIALQDIDYAIRQAGAFCFAT